LRTGSLLVVVGIAIVVLGATLSYSGYSESLQVATLANTIPYTITSRWAVATTSTETIIVRTSSTRMVMRDVYDINGNYQYETADALDLWVSPRKPPYCGMYWGYYATVDAGQVHVSYESDHAVDFWMLTQSQWERWKAASGCGDPLRILGATAKSLRSKEYEVTVDVPSAERYYFVFLNMGTSMASITLNVEGDVQYTTLTERWEHTHYSTMESPLVTETVTFTSRPAGLGILFFLDITIAAAGIGLAVAGLAVGRIRGTRITKLKPPPEALPSVYAEYLAKLDQLRAQGIMSEQVYQSLRREYEEKMVGK